MAEDDTIFDGSLRDLNPKNWVNRLSDYIRDTGHWDRVSDDHAMLKCGSGNRLLVTFEYVQDIQAKRKNALPLGVEYSHLMGWSCLSVIATKPTWFRDPVLYARFDDLVDDGYFEEFESVLFYGTKMGGYGAAAYSVTSPGANVVVIQPQATLDPRVTEWDQRFTSKRKLDFTSRYGYAPDMIEAAGQASVIYDPQEEMDAMHAALFTRPNVDKLRARWMGSNTARVLDDGDMLRPILAKAIKGQLDPDTFAELYRRRRDSADYMRKLVMQLEDLGRKSLAARVCRAGIKRGRNTSYFRQKLAELDPDSLDRDVTEQA